MVISDLAFGGRVYSRLNLLVHDLLELHWLDDIALELRVCDGTNSQSWSQNECQRCVAYPWKRLESS